MQVYWLSALGLFVYQTLDALDGKQARRTGSSSPLGQLFDHGCDALSTIFNVLSALATVQIGAGIRAYIALSSVSTTFYLAQWEEYHTGVMSCGNGFYGVTEGQLTLVAIHVVTALFGPAMWTASLPLMPFTLADVLAVALVASNVILAYSNVTNVLNAPADAIPRAELGNKHVSKPLAISQLIPIAILLVLGSLWVSGPNRDDYAAYPVVFLFAIGIGNVLFSVRCALTSMG
jgi:ethanolaminephosphotransferase